MKVYKLGGDMMKKKKGISLIFLILIIGFILLVGGLITFLVTKNIKSSGNDKYGQEIKSKNANKAFFNGDYSIVYDNFDFSDSFWNLENESYSAMTNKEYFFNKYMFQVLGQDETEYGGNISMPLKPSYTMYYRINEGSGADEECEYFLKVDFNKEHIFYPNMMLGSLSGLTDQRFIFSVIDSDMNFSQILADFEHQRITTKEESLENSNYKLLLEDNNWAFFEMTNNKNTTIYADYYINLEKRDYIHFQVNLKGKLNDNAVKEFINKIKNNIQISKIEDPSTCEYLVNLRPSSHFFKLESKDEIIKISDTFSLNMKDKYLRVWGSSDKRILVPSLSSTNNVNNIQWYDKNVKNGLAKMSLTEYVDGSKNGIEKVIKAYFGSDIEIKDYSYKDVKIKMVYDTDSSSYKVTNGYSNFDGISFELDGNVYMIEKSEMMKEEEISEFIKYIFENVISTNK